MKILLDECVDRRLAREIVGHEVTTTQQRGWSGIDNGELLRLAAADFDVFVTVDRNLSFQQPVVQFDIAVVILRAASNRIGDIVGAADAGSAARNDARSGHLDRDVTKRRS